MTDNVETTEEQLTVDDILNEAEKAPYSPILKVWREVLESSKEVRKEKITPQWASRVTSAHNGVTFPDMPAYRDLYYQRIDELATVLQFEIDSDDECLNYTTPEEDLEHNGIHYLSIIIGWQKTILTWELDWDCTRDDAAIDLACIAEVHKMFFGETGLASLLDQIKFEFTEGSQQLLYTELEELKSEWEADE